LGFEKPTILSDRRQLLRPPLNCRASGFVQSILRARIRKIVFRQHRPKGDIKTNEPLPIHEFSALGSVN
jgi:hypothetical protein